MYFVIFDCQYSVGLQYRVAPVTEMDELEYPGRGGPEAGVRDVREVDGEVSPCRHLEGERLTSPAQETDGGLGPGLGTGHDQSAPCLRPLEEDPVHQPSLPWADLAGVPHIAVTAVVLVTPRVGPVDRLPINIQPSSQLAQSLLKYWNNHAVLVGAHIHQEVAPAAHCDGQLLDELLDAVDVGELHVPPVSPALPECGRCER